LTVRNRKVVGLSRKGKAVCLSRRTAVGLSGAGELLVFRNRTIVALSGTAEQLVCQEQESCWSVRNRKSAGLSGQESRCSVRKKADDLSGTGYLPVFQEINK
jgi:hypothetical protein